MKFFINKPSVKRQHYIAVPLIALCFAASSLSFAFSSTSDAKTFAPYTVSLDSGTVSVLIADASPKTPGSARELAAPVGPAPRAVSTPAIMAPDMQPVPARSAATFPSNATSGQQNSAAPSSNHASTQSRAAGQLPALGQNVGGDKGAVSTQSASSPQAATAPVNVNSAALPPSRDSQPAMDALQSMNPSGWTSSALKIYLPGIDPAVNVASNLSSNPALAVAPSEDVQKAASNAPQFMPFDQLGSEVDAQRVAILREFRCISVYSKNYKRGQRLIVARVYTFDSPECACGAYSLLHQGASTVVRRGDGSSEDDQGISFWQGRTFVSVYGTSIDDDESKEVVRTIADKFSSTLKEHAGLPPILEQLPRLDRVKGSERIVMGTLSARRFSPAPFLNYLDFSHASEAATADYQIQSPPDRLKLLYVDYRFPGWAAAAYRTYTQQFAGRAVTFEEPVIGETCMYKVNGTFILCQQVGGHLAIISGARKKQSASQLARFLH